MVRFREYDVKDLIYEGKNTIVYKSYDEKASRNVILKTVSFDKLKLASFEEIEHEYQITKKVNGVKGITKVYSIENLEGRPVLVKEYFAGSLFKKLIINKELDLDRFLAITIQLVDIVEEIHKNKVIHLDINPNNILVNEKDEVRIIDFGNSKLMSQAYQKENDFGKLEGTLAYISPEQIKRTNKEMDYRSDYYSLGVTFYQALTRKLPFSQHDKIELIYSHIANEPLSPIQENNTLPKVLSDIVMKLMAKMPEDRYQSLLSLKKDLVKCQEILKTKGSIDAFKIAEGDIFYNFKTPKKIYDRNHEHKKILEIYEKVLKGGIELILIKGYAGVGKSTLVNEIQNELANTSTYFVSGKFEQFQSEIPYSAIIKALEDFISQLLIEPKDILQLWREKILKAVGNNGQVIIDVIPSLKIIIGEQKPVPKLEPVENQNRFNHVFEKFIKVIAQKEHPFIIFIDDLQWADSASLKFIKMLMTNPSIQYLLIIGAYRDNEIEDFHPLTEMKQEIVKGRTNFNIIQLNNLEKEGIQEFLENTFYGIKKQFRVNKEPIDFLYNKTQGNPFFLKQFIKTIYDNKYIWFDHDLLKWYWDNEKIKQLNITDNVVDLLVEKVNKLNSSVKQVLINAACIGNQFDLKTMELIINHQSSEEILEILFLIIDEGLISVAKNGDLYSKEKNIKFSFIHDDVQHAVYSIYNKNKRKKIHLHIGRILLNEYQKSSKDDQIFEIVRHLNEAKELINNETEQIKLAELNYKIGKTSKCSSAFKASHIYFKTGIEMLKKINAWDNYYDLTLKLYSEITEISYLISNYEQMEKFAEIVLINAKTMIDTVKVYNTIIQAYQAQSNLNEALKTGLSVLKLMGINIPEKANQDDIDKAFINVKLAIEESEVEDLLMLPTMNSPKMISAMQIMLHTIPVTYKVAPMLTPILASKMVELSIKHGNSPLSPGAYTFYGLLLCTKKNDIDMGYRFGKVSIKLLENQNLNPSKAIALDMNAYCIKHWKEHLNSTLNQFMQGFKVGIENGNFETSACCLAGHVKNSFYIGRPLVVLEQEITKKIQIIEKTKQCLSLNYKKIFGQLVLNIQGKSKNPLELTGGICNEHELFSVSHKAGDMVGIFFIYICKIMLNYYFEEYAQAVENSDKAEEYLIGVAGMVDIPIYHYFDSLSRLAIYETVSKKEQESIMIRVSENQKKMESWSSHAPMNFLHKFYLVEAERLRIQKKDIEAIDFYDKAIFHAKNSEYINDEALGNELAAKFWFNKNKYRYAKTHFVDAYSAYNIWGAAAKVKHIRNKYIDFFQEKLKNNINKTESTFTTLELVDIHSIIKASQIISQEIVLDELVKKLIKIVIENVGAQKVIFIMKEEDGFVIKGQKEVDEKKISIIQNESLESFNNLPKGIINYVSRTKKTIIMDNCIDSKKFISDKYVTERKPKSVLCFPLIKKKELYGMIYLENNLITGAFTNDRLKVLEILSSQIVISLENARLYEDLDYSNKILDTKVKERTNQLKKERDKLQRYLDIAEVLFILINIEGKITLVNRKTCEVGGYSEDELYGKMWYDFLSSEKEVENSKKHFKGMLKGKLSEYVDRRIKTKTGDIKTISCHKKILRDEKGNIEGLLICALDMTEQKELKEALEYSKLKLEVFANLSHELKTPLNLCFSALQMINLHRKDIKEISLNKKLDTFTHIIKQNNYRLLKLVNNIIDITKINSDSYNLNFQNYDIVKLTKDITSSVKDYVENKNRVLRFNSRIKSKIITCDPFSLERIMLNLLSNAIKFTDEGDIISISLFEKQNVIFIEVLDSGIGISEDKQKMIFERFRQVDKSFTRNNEGSGIGLTIVKLLVELHGGKISVESTSNIYTKFKIKLPINDSMEEGKSRNHYSDGENLIERMDIEFSDVYGL